MAMIYDNFFLFWVSFHVEYIKSFGNILRKQLSI